MSEESLSLKWGTLKGWSGANPAVMDLLQKYAELGMSPGAMMQNDTPEQKTLICQMIDACNGEIWNDWDGEVMTKENAKSYVMNYGNTRSND